MSLSDIINELIELEKVYPNLRYLHANLREAIDNAVKETISEDIDEQLDKIYKAANKKLGFDFNARNVFKRIGLVNERKLDQIINLKNKAIFDQIVNQVVDEVLKFNRVKL